MFLLWRRYTRAGHAPPWFYALMAAGFVALVAWAAVTRDWVVAGIAVAMVGATIAGARVMRRVAEAADASTRLQASKDNHHER